MTVMQADGNCMYRAVHDQLEASSEGDEETQDYLELRQETASYMRAFPDDFMPFIIQARTHIILCSPWRHTVNHLCLVS